MNLEKIIEMKKKVDEMSVEVMKGIEIQTEAINKCRAEREIEMYHYFKEIRASLGADVFGIGNVFAWSLPFQDDEHHVVICIDSSCTVFRTSRFHNVIEWAVNKDGKIRKEFEHVVDAWNDELKEAFENALAEWLRKQTQKQIEKLLKCQTQVNKISLSYGLEEK